MRHVERWFLGGFWAVLHAQMNLYMYVYIYFCARFMTNILEYISLWANDEARRLTAAAALSTTTHTLPPTQAHTVAYFAALWKIKQQNKPGQNRKRKKKNRNNNKGKHRENKYKICFSNICQRWGDDDDTSWRRAWRPLPSSSIPPFHCQLSSRSWSLAFWLLPYICMYIPAACHCRCLHVMSSRSARLLTVHTLNPLPAHSRCPRVASQWHSGKSRVLKGVFFLNLASKVSKKSCIQSFGQTYWRRKHKIVSQGIRIFFIHLFKKKRIYFNCPRIYNPCPTVIPLAAFWGTSGPPHKLQLYRYIFCVFVFCSWTDSSALRLVWRLGLWREVVAGIARTEWSGTERSRALWLCMSHEQ